MSATQQLSQLKEGELVMWRPKDSTDLNLVAVRIVRNFGERSQIEIQDSGYPAERRLKVVANATLRKPEPRVIGPSEEEVV